MKTTKTFYSDAGHGWLAVKTAELHKLNIADKISGFSYERGKSVYLEEDSDAQIYLQAMDKAGHEISIIHKFTRHDKRSPIRSYDRYKGEI